MARVSKTDERMIIDVNVAGYKKSDVKVKCKVDDEKNTTLVIIVGKSSSDEKFGIYKDLNGFRDEIPVNKDIFDLSKISADVVDGLFRISIPKKEDYKTKTLVDFSPSSDDVSENSEE